MDEEPTMAQQEEYARVSLRNNGIIGVLAMASLAAFVQSQSLVLAGSCVLVLAVLSAALYKGREALIMMPVDNKAVLVTGCDTGFGHTLATQLASMGVTVFAGCLNSSGKGANVLRKLDNPKLHVVQMDVTSDRDVQEAASFVRETVGDKGLWGLVNNAGLNFIGDVELTTMAQYEKVANINQLGMVRVTKALLPLVRKAKGRVVNMTSCKGRLSVINDSAYDMTKFAGEAFSDILRMEMAKFGVKVVIIEPCNFCGVTAALEMGMVRRDFHEMWEGMSEELRQTYGKEYVLSNIDRIEQLPATSCNDITLVTDRMVQALFVDSPKTRYLIGGSNEWYDKVKVRVWLYQFLPASYMDGIIISDIQHHPKPKSLA